MEVGSLDIAYQGVQEIFYHESPTTHRQKRADNRKDAIQSQQYNCSSQYNCVSDQPVFLLYSVSPITKIEIR